MIADAYTRWLISHWASLTEREQKIVNDAMAQVKRAEKRAENLIWAIKTMKEQAHG